MIATPNGEIITNNLLSRRASINVVIEKPWHLQRQPLSGTDATADVAVPQVSGVRGLPR